MALREHITDGQYAAGGETGKKLYYEMDNIGKAKYTVNFYDGKDTHTDGSPFYGIRTFQNKEKRDKFVNELKADGYAYRYEDGGMTESEKERKAAAIAKAIEIFTLALGGEVKLGNVVGEWIGGTAMNGKIAFIGQPGVIKMKEISKQFPKNTYSVTDDNYSNIGNFWLKNGKFAKAETYGNPLYDFANHPTTLKGKDDIIYKMKRINKEEYYASGGTLAPFEKERIAKALLPEKYYEKFTLKGNGRSQYSIFGIYDSSSIKQAAKKLFPAMSIAEHKKLAEKYSQEMKAADEQYSKTLDTEFEKLFGRKYEASDYKISGIARDEFSDEVKNKLRGLIDKSNTYYAAFNLHNSVLPAKDKVKKLASGGSIGFAGLEKKVAKEYAGKSVADKYKKQYGSTYDADEAKEVAAKVAGKVKKQQAARKAAPAKKGAKKTKPSVASKYK